MKELCLQETSVSDEGVRSIGQLPNLEDVDLWGCRSVSCIGPLAKLSNLRRLQLHGTRVADLSPLEKLTKLRSLDLTGTPVSDISPLSRLTELEELILTKTSVSDEDVDKLQQAMPNLQITR